jgi:hypothetical protein
MNEAHAFLATNDTVTAGGICSMESLVGYIEERSTVATVTRTMQKAETPAECDIAHPADAVFWAGC